MGNSPISIVEPENSGVIAELPRRDFLKVSNPGSTLAPMRLVTFEADRLQALVRLFTWLNLFLYFAFNTLLDILFRRDNPSRRANRLKQSFEKVGGSFIKLGMHLSMRVDFMPWATSDELSRMSDRMEPFAVELAIDTIERLAKRQLSSIFSHFDPEPIASSSVSCAYQAILITGEKVVVKVRRPGIGEQFMTDLKAFDWLLSIAEFLTIFRPGFTQGMRGEFRELLLEELDFIQEARRQDAFRRAAAESRVGYFSAPRVYLELSGEEVVVEEFASGIWLWELLEAVENRDEAVLARARALNIDPSKVAKRLLWVQFWSWAENLFFHADPDPNNIIIGQDSRLFFINFSTTGALNRSLRQAMHQYFSYAWHRDPLNMARSTLILMEPLPPVDLIELTQELETFNWQLLYALEAPPESLSWQERTSFYHWKGLIQLARKYGIVIDIQVLRLMRSSLLVESTAVRLNHNVDFVRQYRRFNRYRAEQARRRVTDRVIDALDGKTNEQLVIRLDRVAQMAEGFFLRTRHLLSLPSANFNVLMSKWSYAFYIFIHFAVQVVIVTALGVFIAAVNHLAAGIQPIYVPDLLQSVLQNPVYQIIFLILMFINGRTVLFRMDDKEVR